MSVILLLLGLLLIFLEFYLPGMVLGLMGALFIVASLLLFAMQASPLETLFFFFLTGLSIAGVVLLALRRIRRTAKEGTIYLESDQAGYVASSYDEAMVGKEGVALTDLKPAGHARILGRQYQVSSQSGYLVEGTKVKVIGGIGAILIVKPLNKEE